MKANVSDIIDIIKTHKYVFISLLFLTISKSKFNLISPSTIIWMDI